MNALAYGVDASYVTPLAVSLRSVLETWKGGPLEAHVLEQGFTSADRAKVEAMLPPSPGFQLRWHSVGSDLFAGLSTGLHFSRANYFRLLLPETLASLERVLYLDADTVARADLSGLFALADDRFPLQACRDYCGTISNPLIRLPGFAEFGLPANAPYFNTGVLLMNLDAWRREGIAEKVVALGRSRPETLFFADQTAVNLVLHERIGELPPEWNTQLVHPRVADGTWNVPFVPQCWESGRILHYTSEFKPWSQGRELPQAAAYREVLARSGG